MKTRRINRKRASAAAHAFLFTMSGLFLSSPLQASPDDLPIYEAEASPDGRRSDLLLTVVAPGEWSDREIRRALLDYAATLAEQNEAACFSIEQAGLNRLSSFVPLHSGHMTIEIGDSTREWKRYWQLYRLILQPGVRLYGRDAPARIGTAATRATMRIHLCGDGEKAEGRKFDVSTILASSGRE